MRILWVMEINAIAYHSFKHTCKWSVMCLTHKQSPLHTEVQNHSRSYEWSWSSLNRKLHHKASIFTFISHFYKCKNICLYKKHTLTCALLWFITVSSLTDFTSCFNRLLWWAELVQGWGNLCIYLWTNTYYSMFPQDIHNVSNYRNHHQSCHLLMTVADRKLKKDSEMFENYWILFFTAICKCNLQNCLETL